MSAVLSFHGAAGCVTGSCARLRTARADILLDCGLFQGSKTLKALNYEPFPFEPATLDAVLLTHAHIDHTGLLPKLILAGYAGPVFATAGTRALSTIMLPDAGAIQEMEVESLNRRRVRRGEAPVEPIYTARDAENAIAQFQTVALNEWRDVAPGVRARWWNAGHILGSASIEIEVADEGERPLRLLFSGDIGPGGREFASDPEGPSDLDHVVIESTYGGAERPMLDAAARRAALTAELLAAHAAGGPLLIPAFAVERTQELLVDLLEVMESNQAPPGPIFLDSPLAIRATDVFLRHGANSEQRNPFGGLRERGWLRFTESANESRDIERFRGWHVIIAASGMCDAGRVRHHLKRLLWRREASVMLVGFQPVGTLGRLLLEGRSEVRIQGEPFKVRARIRNLDVYSGHADGAALVRWIKARAPVHGTIFITHGEPENAQALEKRLRAETPNKAIVRARLDQSYRLRAATPGEPAAPTQARIDADAVSRLDWHNARVAFMTDLEARLKAAASDAERKALLDKLSATLGEPQHGP